MQLAFALPQVADAARDLANEPNADVWALKLIVLACVGAVGWLGRMLAKRPREREVNALMQANERLRDELRSEREKREEVRRQQNREIDKLHNTVRKKDLNILELKMQLGQTQSS